MYYHVFFDNSFARKQSFPLSITPQGGVTSRVYMSARYTAPLGQGKVYFEALLPVPRPGRIAI